MPGNHGWRARCGALAADEGGQISALGVAGAAAFACLLVLVLNTGYGTSEKVRMQNAADAAVISGATWVARGLNLISANNVAQTQILAIVLIIPALDRAVNLALTTARLELAACPALVLPVLIVPCEIYFTLAVNALNGLQFVTGRLQPLANRGSVLWTAMKALESISGGIAGTFPAVAIGEAYRISTQNGADAAVLIAAAARPPRSVLPSLPVRRGAMRPDLCDPTRFGSPSMSSRGYAPLLGYEIGQGPLERFAGSIAGTLRFSWLWPTGLPAYFDTFREASYYQMCGGGRSAAYDRPVDSLNECRAADGTAHWAVAIYDTKALPARDPSVISIARGDPRLEGEVRAGRAVRPCSWTPPGRIVGGKYRAVEETIEPAGSDASGKPVFRYRYRVFEYTFVRGTVSEPSRRIPASGSSDDPAPYLLGASAAATAEQIRGELRYLAVAYRAREVEVAPAYFISPFGRHRLTYAQSRVYNPTAFDTFTQDWRVRLEPASMLEDGSILAVLGAGAPARAGAGLIPVEGFNRATGFFGGLGHDLNLLRWLNNH